MTGVIGMLDVAGFPGLMEICAIVLALIIVVALMTYQVAYSRLIFVSGPGTSPAEDLHPPEPAYP